ncbi:MAG: hypothetical protein CMD72_05360 [Gammaproteobacteria bacterium]|nr:hypothetical protein [Gammaproteobacteria bacterium]
MNFKKKYFKYKSKYKKLKILINQKGGDNQYITDNQNKIVYKKSKYDENKVYKLYEYNGDEKGNIDINILDHINIIHKVNRPRLKYYDILKINDPETTIVAFKKNKLN